MWVWRDVQKYQEVSRSTEVRLSPLCYTDDFYSYYICPIVLRVYLLKIRYFNTANSKSCAFLSLSDGFSYIFVEKFLPSPLVMVTTTILEFFRWKQLAWKLQKLFKHRTQYFYDFSDKKMFTKSNLKRIRQTLLIQIIKP